MKFLVLIFSLMAVFASAQQGKDPMDEVYAGSTHSAGTVLEPAYQASMQVQGVTHPAACANCAPGEGLDNLVEGESVVRRTNTGNGAPEGAQE